MAFWGTGNLNNYHAGLCGFVGFGMFWAVRLEAGSGLTAQRLLALAFRQDYCRIRGSWGLGNPKRRGITSLKLYL